MSKGEAAKIGKIAKSNNGRISAKDYKAIMSNSSEVKTKGQKKPKLYDYSFVLKVEKISDDEYEFVMYGRHFRTNEYNGWLSLGRRSAYKNAIKQSANDYFLKYRKIYKKIMPLIPFEQCVVLPIAYNPSSRDDDGNSATLKYFRDNLVRLKFAKDDSRKYMRQLLVEEVKSKEYKIVLQLKRVDNIEEYLKNNSYQARLFNSTNANDSANQ